MTIMGLYMYFIVSYIFLILVISRIAKTAFRIIFKSIKSIYINIDRNRNVKIFKCWLDQTPNE